MTDRVMSSDQSQSVAANDSEMARRIRAFNWAATPIGPSADWSHALRFTVDLLLANRFPLLLWWGPQYVSIYNDAYAPILGAKHPEALGLPVRECWSEIWHILQPLIDGPFHGGPPTWIEDLMMEVNRHGYLEEGHWTVAYSPVPDDAVPGGVGGVLATVHEITEKVIGERRTTVLRDLAARATEGKTPDEAATVAAETIARHPMDIPFALLYLINAEGNVARLAGSAGFTEAGAASAATIDLQTVANNQYSWPVADVIRTGNVQVVGDLSQRVKEVPAGPWDDPPAQAVMVPIRSTVAHRPAGVLIAGVSARLKLDARYQDFYEFVAGHIATALANARAYDEERQRAEAFAEIDRAKTVFFSNVSHEFRTPLTLMLGPLELLLHSEAPDSVKRELDVITRNGLRLFRLVNTLLDFSRVEAGRLAAQYVATDLAALTADLASSFRSLCEQAGLRLLIDCPPLSEPLYVDQDMWEKIVLNLLSNAFKYTFVGEIEVSLRETVPPSSTHPTVTLRVRDTGTGIPAEALPRLFERFYRVDGARGRTFEGTGIGLALIQELVKVHGGTVRVDSLMGAGSTFYVTLPFGTSHLPADRLSTRTSVASTVSSDASIVEEARCWLPSDASPLPEIPSSHDEKPIVLLADDNADMRQYVTRILSPRFTVRAVVDGQAALESALAKPPDVILTDVMMPRLDGLSLLRALRESPATKTVPVILLSARVGEESRVEGLDHGADDYLIKPFSARELLARVQAHVRMARLRREADTQVRHFADNAPAMLWVTEPDGTCSFLSRGWQEFTGLSEQESLGWGWLHSLHPDDLSAARETFVTANARRESFAIEYRVRRADGRWRWVIDAGRPRFGETGSFLGYAGSLLDITERREAEIELRESEDKYRAVFESIDEGICILEILFNEQGEAHDYRFLETNPTFVKLTGLENAVGATVRTLLPGLDDYRIAVYGRVASTGMPVWFDHYSVRLRRWFSVHASRIDSAASRRVAVVFTDITERKQAEERERRAAARDAFRVALADAIRPLTDPVEIQATTSRILGERLLADRVAYFEVRDQHYSVARDYANGVTGLAGGYSIASFGERLLSLYRGGQTAYSCDVAGDTALTPAERAAYAAIQIGAYIGVPLVKDGELVAGLTVHAARPRQWTAEEISLVEETAERTWAAVERARAEAALRQSERRLQRVLETDAVGVLFFDTGGTVIRANEAFLQMTGYTRERVERRELTWRTMTPSEWVQESEAQLARFAQTGRIGPYEKQYLMADGSPRWMLFAGRDLGDGTIVEYCLDIHERKRSELLLTEQQHLLECIATGRPLADCLHALTNAVSRLQPHARAAVILAGDDGNMVADYHSGQLDSTFGAALIGMSLKELVICMGGTALLAGEPVVCPDIAGATSASQSWRDLCLAHNIRACYVVPVLGTGGNALASFFLGFAEPREPGDWERRLVEFGVHIAGVALERERVQAALHESEARFKILADSAPVLIWMNGPTGADFVNRAYLDFIGEVGQLDVANFEWLHYVHPDDRQPYLAAYSEAMRKRTPFDAEFRFRRHDGEYRRMRSVAQPRYSATNDVVGYVGASYDITEIREAQEHIQRWNVELERAVSVKTTELVRSEARLRALATELNLAEQRERKRLATELHDHLQQLLVLGKLKLGQAKALAPSPPAVATFMAQADEVLSDALKYTRTLMADLSPSVLREHGLVAGLRWLAERMKQHDLTVTVVIPGLSRLNIPEDQEVLLFQSVRELFINASKHARTREATLELRQQDERLIIEVGDCGIGFDLNTVDRSGGELSSKFGLFSIRERMQALGGTFTIDSAPGVGTRARLTLPLPTKGDARKEMVALTPALTSAGPAAAISAQVTRIRVLLVDDHAMVREGLRTMLNNYADIEVVGEASNGEEAVFLADRLGPAVIIMDINMPQMNGIDATAKIKASHPHIVVIGLSVNAGAENREAMERAGASLLLTKEAAVDRLYSSIHEMTALVSGTSRFNPLGRDVSRS